jgi:WD40 repeat protein
MRVLFKNDKPASAGAVLNNGRCAYTPDGRVFIVWGTFQYMHLWDRDAGRDLIEPFTWNSNTFDVAWHGDVVARGNVGPQMTLDFLSLRTGKAVAPTLRYSNWPFLTRFNEDGTLLLTAGGGKTAEVWDWRAGKLICPALPHDEAIMAGCFVPGTPWVITGGHDGAIKLWDRRTGMLIRPPLQRSGQVLDLRLTPDAKTLIAHVGGKIEAIDLAALFPSVGSDPDSLLLRAEIDADAIVHPGGGLVSLTPQTWLEKWRQWRQRESPGTTAAFASPPGAR